MAYGFSVSSATRPLSASACTSAVFAAAKTSTGAPDSICWRNAPVAPEVELDGCARLRGEGSRDLLEGGWTWRRPIR